MKGWKIALFALVIMMSPTPAHAQQKQEKTFLPLHSINSVGRIEGQAGSAFQLQTVNGVNQGSWFAGLGLGLDYYRIRSIPLFVDLRKEFGKAVNRLFVYAEAGENFSWRTDNQAKQFFLNDKMKNGWYGEAGGGYLLRLSTAYHLSISIAYSYKTLTETGSNISTFVYFGPNGPENPTEEERISYHLNRLSLKLGFEF
jgi:hypothetical protein